MLRAQSLIGKLGITQCSDEVNWLRKRVNRR